MIEIEKSETADTRSCDFSHVTKELLYVSSIQHINDVKQGMDFFKVLIDEAVKRHDFDKLTDIDGFYRDSLQGSRQLNGGIIIKK
mgnify:CR=1 FL=1